MVASNKQENTDGTRREGKTASKYCKYHKNAYHDSSECRALQKKYEQRGSPLNKNTSSYLIHVPNLKSTTLEFSGKIKETPIALVVDPGATTAFISAGEAKRLGVTKKKLERPGMTQVASGEQLKVVEETTITFTFDRIKSQTFTEKFHIIPGDLQVLLLGGTFLEAQEMQIDYRDGRIRINVYYLFFDEKQTEWR